jgi:hypothetical protein
MGVRRRQHADDLGDQHFRRQPRAAAEQLAQALVLGFQRLYCWAAWDSSSTRAPARRCAAQARRGRTTSPPAGQQIGHSAIQRSGATTVRGAAHRLEQARGGFERDQHRETSASAVSR